MKVWILFGCGIIWAQEQLRLIQTRPDSPGKWMTEEQVFGLVRARRNFFDITEGSYEKVLSKNSFIEPSPIPTKLSYKELVSNAQSKIQVSEMKSFLTNLSSFHTRYYTSPTGVEAALFILEEAKRAGALYGDAFSVTRFNHSWAQPSIIARIQGQTQEKVILGSHLDSINQYDPKTGRSPGADDDGTGATSILEVLRCLAQSNFRPKRTVEFHFYAAEEIGLKGSQAIAQTYQKDRSQVIGMLQLDMTGYLEKKKTKILVDYTDPQLSEFLRQCIDTYSQISWFNGMCGYACSDHASFDRAGFRSVQAGEDVINPHMHTQDDTLNHIDFENVVQFSNIAIGFVIELAEPSSN